MTPIGIVLFSFLTLNVYANPSLSYLDDLCDDGSCYYDSPFTIFLNVAILLGLFTYIIGNNYIEYKKSTDTPESFITWFFKGTISFVLYFLKGTWWLILFFVVVYYFNNKG